MTTDPATSPPAHEPSAERVMTVPNVLTVARIAGCGALVWLAYAGQPRAFVVLFVVLMVTDWLDGKLAILLDQRTVLGARLDSVADVIMYAVLVLGVAWLRPEFIRAETTPLALMGGSYLLSIAVSFARFGRLPAYHTRAAKTCWLLAAIGAVTLLVDGPAWPARVVIFAVIVTNLEAVAISFVLRRWETDVASVLHARRRARTE